MYFDTQHDLMLGNFYLLQVRVPIVTLSVQKSRTVLLLLLIKILILGVLFGMRNPKMISPLGGIWCMVINREAVTFPTSSEALSFQNACKYLRVKSVTWDVTWWTKNHLIQIQIQNSSSNPSQNYWFILEHEMTQYINIQNELWAWKHF